jgi:hypothetical protein
MRIPVLAFLLASAALPTAASAQIRPDTSALTARLGVDTISIERVIRTPRTITAELVTRSPRTSLQRHYAELDAAGMLTYLDVTALDPATGSVLRRTTHTLRGDSLEIVDVAADRSTVRRIAAPREWLPFVDLVHWPFDVALRRLRASGTAKVDAPMLSGNRVSPFPLALSGRDSATVTHPTRGTMRLTVLADGAIRTLDAGATTRALIVTRSRDADVPAFARTYAARDAAGRGVGELSGRGGGDVRVLGATINLDYGVPMKRGREIWGALVKYGQLWRTGANRATHFKTDRTLRFGDVVVPPGEYTLYSIPEANGGVLIINKQTGQNGQQYDAARDLGRVPLRARPLTREVESFTILPRAEGQKGLRALQWDRTELVAEFTVERP